jgi:pimeloyl-ACP methyl ester carboxylesterase
MIQAETMLPFIVLFVVLLGLDPSGTSGFSVQQQQQTGSIPGSPISCPKYSPATGLENKFYVWKEGQKIRYQCTENTSNRRGGEPVLLIHGLFVNSDHWRRSLKALGDAGYAAYALDLFGCGYSDKPSAGSAGAQRVNGERGRFPPSVLESVELGTASGRDARTVDVDLHHPLGSPYNFFTWADLIADFSRDVIRNDKYKTTLVCNSIGTISAQQAVMDHPDFFSGVFVVCPNFRELHSAEIPYATFTMPVIRAVQKLLRERGQGLFDALAKPDIVRNILSVPYAVKSAIDDVLIKVLLDPLLTEGASQVVFDTLAYSAGPLPEQQLQQFPANKPVWICYGDQDPWTPGPRVEAMIQYSAVERVDRLPGVGHCPHDEAPEQVHPLLFEFLKRVHDNSTQ